MGKQVIGIGTTANDGTGDAIRTAFDKVNQNFTELYTDDAGDVNSVAAGTGITVNQTTGAVTVTNSEPDQTVAITDSYGIDSSGTYPNFTLEVSGTIDQNGLASELKYWSGTQGEYDALTPNANTIYFIS